MYMSSLFIPLRNIIQVIIALSELSAQLREAVGRLTVVR
jgi:hypothetical protein